MKKETPPVIEDINYIDSEVLKRYAEDEEYRDAWINAAAKQLPFDKVINAIKVMNRASGRYVPMTNEEAQRYLDKAISGTTRDVYDPKGFDDDTDGE